MRTNSFAMLIFALCAIALCSCDSNKGKVKELATQFVTAYNEGDKATIYDLFPIIKTTTVHENPLTFWQNSIFSTV